MFEFLGARKPEATQPKPKGPPPRPASKAEVKVVFIPDAFADTLARLVEMADQRADALRESGNNRKMGTDYHNLAKLIDSCRDFAKEKEI